MAEKREKTEYRIQETEYSKHKNQNHNKIHSVKSEKMLFNRLIDLGLLA
jgi:hypothetical protein